MYCRVQSLIPYQATLYIIQALNWFSRSTLISAHVAITSGTGLSGQAFSASRETSGALYFSSIVFVDCTRVFLGGIVAP
jgi:hypothetical protein